MTATPWGYPADGSDPTGGIDDSGYNTFAMEANFAAPYVCPGTGSQKVDWLRIWTRSEYLTATYRLAIYDASGNLVCQGSVGITTGSYTRLWLTHTEFVDVNGNPWTGTLTGGATYYFAWSGVGTGVGVLLFSQSGASYYATGKTYVADGFPGADSEIKINSFPYFVPIQCGVEAASAGATPINTTPSDDLSAILSDISSGRYIYKASAGENLET